MRRLESELPSLFINTSDHFLRNEHFFQANTPSIFPDVCQKIHFYFFFIRKGPYKLTSPYVNCNFYMINDDNFII